MSEELMSDQLELIGVHTEMRQGRRDRRVVYMHSPAYPAGEIMARFELEWVAADFVRWWNTERTKKENT